jgi:pimeloyl-ACP methyl ester carboxylesterase
MRLASARLDGDSEGVELGYVDWGNPAAARTVVCVHGLTRNSRDFDVLAEALADLGARVIAIDMVGRGRSSRLTDPKGYTVGNYAVHVARFLALLRLNGIDWVGTSMGGLIGMTLAARDESPIKRLVLNDVGPLVPKSALADIRAYLGLDLKFATLDELEQHLRVIHAGFGPLTDDQWRHLAHHSAREADGVWRLSYDPAIRIPYAQSADADLDLWQAWEKIACPTLVLRGAESPILSADTVERMRVSGPRAEVATFAGVGHAPALMAEDQIAAVAHWLGFAEIRAAQPSTSAR